MASGKLRSVSVVFQAFTDKFEKSIDKASNKMTNFGKKVAAGVVGFVAARASIGGYINQLEKLQRLSQSQKKLGVDPNFLRGIQFAAESAGESIEGATDLIQEFNIRLGEAVLGAGPAVNGLQILGLQMDHLNKLSPEQTFLKVADALSKLEDPQLQIFAAGELFGGKGEDMLNILQQGEAGLRSFIREAEQFGGVITVEDLARIEESNKAVERMQKAWDGIVTTLAIELAPVLKGIANIMTEMVGIVRSIGKAYNDFTDKLADYMLIANYYLFGGENGSSMLKSYDMLVDAINAGGPEPAKKRDTDPLMINRQFQPPEWMMRFFRDGATETAKAIEPLFNSVQTFITSMGAGSSAAFRALNPAQTFRVEEQQLKETRETNTILGEINSKIGAGGESVEFIGI